ncbi:MAG: hypothetical protein WBG95_12155 [Sulfitobacter sp.]
MITLAFSVLSHTVESVARLTADAFARVGMIGVSEATKNIELKKTVAAQRADFSRKEQDVSRMSSRLAASEANAKALSREIKDLKRANMVTFRGKPMPLREAAGITAKSISQRTSTVAAANVASAAGQSVPFFGIGIIVGATGYELSMACQSMRDLEELEKSLGIAQESVDARVVCGLEVPSKEELWSTVQASPSAAWESAKSGTSDSMAWVSALETPDFGGMFQRALNWFRH